MIRIVVEELPRATRALSDTVASMGAFETVNDARAAARAAASALRRHVMVAAANAETEARREAEGRSS